MTDTVTPAELVQFLERIEALDASKRDLAEDRKGVIAEAVGRGFDKKALLALVVLRRQKPDDLAEFEAVLDLYKAAVGMA